MKETSVSFIRPRKILYFNLYMNKKFIIFASSFWFLVSLATIYCFTLLDIKIVQKFGLYIWKYQMPTGLKNGGYQGNNQDGLASALKIIIFGAPSIIYYSLISIYFINKTLLNEIESEKIYFWLSLPFSRKTNIMQKLLFNILVFLIIYLPIFLIIILYGSLCKDANQYMGFLFLDAIDFAIFMIFLITIYFLISLLLTEKVTIYNVIISVLLLYIFATYILNLLPWDVNENFAWAKYIRYISMQSLFVSSLQISNNIASIPDYIPPDKTIFLKYDRNFNGTYITLICIIDLLEIIAIYISAKISIKIFDKKEL